MTIELISLKTYWYFEQQHNIQTQTQKLHNKWIDCILSMTMFSKESIQAAIEFADFLFVRINEHDNVVAFAICVDHPNNSKIFYNRDLFQTHGFVEIVLLGSIIKGNGQLLLNEIKKFSSLVLLRNSIKLSLIDSSLEKYYTKQGFSSTSQKNVMQFIIVPKK